MTNNLLKDLLPFELTLFNKLQQLNATKNLVVALSGGLDSKSLLHALVQLRDQKLIEEFSAVHVDHGLQKISAQWLEQCQTDCRGYQVELITTNLKLAIIDQNKTTGNKLSGIEEMARDGRYAFFQSVLRPAESLVMAHHLDDQAETLLFRLLRGCGIEGASGIPQTRKLGKANLIRPMLNISRCEIEDYAQQNKLAWVEDPTNQTELFARNFLRHQILPRLKQRWPGYAKTLSRFTQVAREQSLLLEEIAIEDLALTQNNLGALRISHLLGLSHSRQKNLLHYWGKDRQLMAPSNSEIEQVINQLNAAVKQSISIHFAGGILRSYEQCLILCCNKEPVAMKQSIFWPTLNEEICFTDGVSIATEQANNGIRLPNKAEKVWVKPRRGGEKCQPESRDKSTDLKRIYQELKIPPWQRNWLPVIYYDDQIVAVPGVFMVREFLAKEGEPSIQFSLQTNQ